MLNTYVMSQFHENLDINLDYDMMRWEDFGDNYVLALNYFNTDCCTWATSSGGSVQCPWYLQFAYTACALDNPWPYAKIKCANQFAYLERH